MKKFIKILVNCLSVLVVFFYLIIFNYIFQVVVQHKPYANIFGYSLFTIKSGSMEPTIQIGDDILVRIESDYKENDIVVYEDKGMLVCHRVIKMDGNKIITKGDRNNAEDEEFERTLVIGKVIKILPELGKFQSFIKNPIVLISIINAIILSSIFIDFRKNKKIKEIE